MKLVVSQSCEQGTPAGVMKFGRGEYPVEDKGEAGLLVTHEPRRTRKGVVTQTTVSRQIVEKMQGCGVAKLEN